MTNGKTTLKFSHNVPDAIQASIDALTLAMAWTPESELRSEMEDRVGDLKDLHRRSRTARTIPSPR
ncbi:MAG: hypothetical protein F4X47_00695 [Gammaproteobacteria bacterium]|nr:hypothetical protein [Gammaproteobacteria bacterium]MYC50816.1 hypothetical protein [Gammaproteobacteria bacterium]